MKNNIRNSVIIALVALNVQIARAFRIKGKALRQLDNNDNTKESCDCMISTSNYSYTDAGKAIKRREYSPINSIHLKELNVVDVLSLDNQMLSNFSSSIKPKNHLVSNQLLSLSSLLLLSSTAVAMASLATSSSAPFVSVGLASSSLYALFPNTKLMQQYPSLIMGFIVTLQTMFANPHSPLREFLTRKFIPLSWDALQRMLVMEFWRRVWRLIWTVSKSWRPWLDDPSICKNIDCPDWLQRLDTFVVTAVMSGFKSLFQKAVQKRVWVSVEDLKDKFSLDRLRPISEPFNSVTQFS